MAAISIDSGPLDEFSKFYERPKSEWPDLLKLRQEIVRDEFQVSCLRIVDFVRDIDEAWEALEYDSAQHMIEEGYGLSYDDVMHVVEYLERERPETVEGFDKTLKKALESGGKDCRQIVEVRELPDKPGPVPGDSHNCNDLDRGNSADYWASRLKRDASDYFEAWKRGEYRSVRAACIAAGLIDPPKTTTVRCDDIKRAVDTLLKHYDLDALRDEINLR